MAAVEDTAVATVARVEFERLVAAVADLRHDVEKLKATADADREMIRAILRRHDRDLARVIGAHAVHSPDTIPSA